MPILNYTTTVSVDKTIGEIQRALVKAGASQVTIDYADGHAVGFTFVLSGVTKAGAAYTTPFRLPANVDGVAEALGRARVAARYRKTDHVRRVAWRILKDWVEAQLAVIEAGLARPEQVMLPYAVTPDGRTLSEHFTESPQRLLTA